MHLTGLYPDWWQGRRFGHPISMWAAGVTNEATRDNVQRMLAGDSEEWGTGTIPHTEIAKVVPGRGIPGLLDHLLIRHKSGGTSRLQFKAYEQGYQKWQGPTLHVVWFDEEPPQDIYSEGLSRTNATDGMVFLTFTPLEGMTEVVSHFYPEPDTDERFFERMEIDDAAHISQKKRLSIIASYRPHEREARVKGLPMLGSGKIFMVPEDMLIEKAFDIPRSWPQIGGIDFGWDHPTACVWLAWDRDSDTIHVTHCYRQSEATPVVHAHAMKARGIEIPWAWPHDGYVHDRQSGKPLADSYKKLGILMLPRHSTFIDGSYGVEAGVMEMLERMESGRFKVAEQLSQWFDEFRLYHRKDGKIVKEREDLMAATRYAMMMLRFARTLKPRTLPMQDRMGYDPLHPSRDEGPQVADRHPYLTGRLH